MNEQNTRDKEHIFTKKNMIIAGATALFVCLMVIMLVSCGNNQSVDSRQRTAHQENTIQTSDRKLRQSKEIEDITGSAVTIEAVTAEAVTAEAVTTEAVTPEAVQKEAEIQENPEIQANAEVQGNASANSGSQTQNQGSSSSGKTKTYTRYEDGVVWTVIEIDCTTTRIRDAMMSNDTSNLTAEDLPAYEKLKSVINYANNFSHPADKEKAVHDWIINNVEYDYENYYNNTIPHSSFDAAGVLITGKAVCSGYSDLFHICMDILNIECRTVSGKGNGGAHAWNAVQLDGEWYMVDVTWDDHIIDGVGIRYEYFNVTDAQLRKTHTYGNAPACNGTKYSYFNYYEKAVTTTDDCYAQLSQAIREGKTSVQLNVTTEVINALRDAMPNVRSPFDYKKLSRDTGKAVYITMEKNNYRAVKTADDKAVQLCTFQINYFINTVNQPVVYSMDDINQVIIDAANEGIETLDILVVDGVSGRNWNPQNIWSVQPGLIVQKTVTPVQGTIYETMNAKITDYRECVAYSPEEARAMVQAAIEANETTVRIIVKGWDINYLLEEFKDDLTGSHNIESYGVDWYSHMLWIQQ